jgi:ATP-binding protein involved in chromosome partitioning
MVTVKQVTEALREVMDPELKRNLVELGMIRNVQVENSRVRFVLALTTLACPLKDQLVADAKRAVLALDGIEQVDVELAEMSVDEKRRLGYGETKPGSAEHLNDIRHVITVMSGKGGVGKSLVSGLLAVALRREGHRVGILDADITGPSIPKMFFAHTPRPGASPLAILPVESRTGIKVMSINLLLESDDQAVIWRGPLIGRTIQQFWGEVFWGTLDYLIVDLPPGTSDASLTVMQSLPSSGIVLVTSPQDLAGMVVRKAAQMAQRLGIPLLGLVENMSYFVCPDTGKQYDIFGPSRAEELALRLGTFFLGRLPIDPEIARLCDAGHIEDYPVEPFRPMAQRIVELATTLRKPSIPAA